MTVKRQLFKTVAAWVILGLFMALFQPDKLPVVVLIVPFVLLFMAFYSLWNLLSTVRARYFSKKDAMVHKPLGIALSLSGVLLIVLQSLGQLTLRDVVTVLAIVIIGYIYLTRSRFIVPKR